MLFGHMFQNITFSYLFDLFTVVFYDAVIAQTRKIKRGSNRHALPPGAAFINFERQCINLHILTINLFFINKKINCRKIK